MTWRSSRRSPGRANTPLRHEVTVRRDEYSDKGSCAIVHLRVTEDPWWSLTVVEDYVSMTPSSPRSMSWPSAPLPQPEGWVEFDTELLAGFIEYWYEEGAARPPQTWRIQAPHPLWVWGFLCFASPALNPSHGKKGTHACLPGKNHGRPAVQGRQAPLLGAPGRGHQQGRSAIRTVAVDDLDKKVEVIFDEGLRNQHAGTPSRHARRITLSRLLQRIR